MFPVHNKHIALQPLSYVHTCAGRLRSGGGLILTFPLRYRGYVHTYAERTRSGRGFLEDNDGLERVHGFEADAANWVLDPFLAERILLPLRLRSATAHVWTHVMICVEANFPPASARVRPRMCERTFIHVNPPCSREDGGKKHVFVIATFVLS